MTHESHCNFIEPDSKAMKAAGFILGLALLLWSEFGISLLILVWPWWYVFMVVPVAAIGILSAFMVFNDIQNRK